MKPVEVIQGDEEAATSYLNEVEVRLKSGVKVLEVLPCEDGSPHPLALAFAKHRLAYQSEAPAQGEGIGESGPLPRESAGKEILIRAKICYPGSAVSDILIGGSLLVQISNEALRSALAKPILPLADREAIAREAFSGHDRMDKEGLDRWRAIADRTNGHDIMPINATSVRRLIATIDCLLSLPPSPVGEGIPTDVRRLVIAARMVAFDGDCDETKLRELDQASEAFADRVPWDDEPTPPTPAPVRGE